MRATVQLIASALATAAVLAATALPASAACTRLGFSVNDYGKDGPTTDAKSLLDKYVAKWAKDHGIAKYQTGKKDVNCELFLNFIVFDEHTCRAEATVCWDGAPIPNAQSASKAVVAPKSAAVTDGATSTAKPAAIRRAAAPVAPSKPKAAAIETGTLPAASSVPVAAAPAPTPVPAATPAVATASTATADQALAAAEKAAAAAERAAAAAERAAAAAAKVERAPAAKQ
jgi:hypothetical protein